MMGKMSDDNSFREKAFWLHSIWNNVMSNYVKLISMHEKGKLFGDIRSKAIHTILIGLPFKEELFKYNKRS